jgi:hypothetical protein
VQLKSGRSARRLAEANPPCIYPISPWQCEVRRGSGPLGSWSIDMQGLLAGLILIAVSALSLSLSNVDGSQCANSVTTAGLGYPTSLRHDVTRHR